MSGEIKHNWNGSVLTVISDSGASSADLQGPKGDTGPRGPQGPAGVILDGQGNIVLDLASYITYEEASSNYASKNYVSAEIAKAQLEGADVDTSAFATKEDIAGLATKDELDDYATQADLAAIEVDIDNATIIKDGNGNLKTAIGGYEAGYYAKSATDSIRLEVDKAVGPDDVLCFEVKFEDGSVETFVVKCGDTLSSINAYLSATIISKKAVYCEGIYVTVKSSGAQVFSTKGVSTANEPAVTGMTLTLGNAPGGYYVPIDAHFIPVDGTTVQVNGDGQLTAIAGGSVDLSNYYTKAEIDSMDFGGGSGSDADLSNYYTKAEIDAKIPTTDNYYTKNEVDNKITYGTTNLIPGVSSLATGTLYVVYE